MKSYWLPSLFAAIVLALSGCAYNELRMRLDIYNEDPTVVEPTEAEIKGYLTALQSAKTSGTTFASDRVTLGQNVFDFYKSIQELASVISKVPLDEKGKQTRAGYLEEYKRAIGSAVSKLMRDIETARSYLLEYQRKLQSQPEGKPVSGQLADERAISNIRASLVQVSDDLNSLAQPLGTDFEKTFLAMFSSLPQVLSPDNLKEYTAYNKQFDALRSRLKQLQNTVENLAKAGSSNMEAVSHQLTEAADNLTNDPTEITQTITNLVPNPSLTEEARSAQNRLAYDTRFNDIDRLQDPADPMWRILSAPENERHWNTAFATNYFYAEGNSSVTVVRDDPISYRVQRGNNNPTALIQSQLQISRSIADAAIEIAGSASGLKVAPPATGQKATSTNEPVPVSQVTTEFDKKLALRNQAMKDLQQKLATLRDDFVKNGTNDIQRTNLLVQLQGLLKGDSLIFKPSTNSY